MPNVPQTAEIREAILDATDRLLERYGYKKMTIDDLAREVGIGKGSVYLHFSSKQEIALSHVDRIVERVKTELESIAESRLAPSEKIRQMLMARVLVRFDNVRHYTRNINELLADLRPQLLERRRKHFRLEAKVFVRVIENGQQSGAFHTGDAAKLAESFLTATNALLPASLTARELGKKSELQEKVLRLANLMLEGLEARRTA